MPLAKITAKTNVWAHRRIPGMPPNFEDRQLSKGEVIVVDVANIDALKNFKPDSLEVTAAKDGSEATPNPTTGEVPGAKGKTEK